MLFASFSRHSWLPLAPRGLCVRLLTAILVFVLATGPLLASGDGARPSLFDKLKAKVSAKVEQVKDRDWLMTKLGGKVVGFVCGKAGGLVGAALGAAAGACLGGPMAMGIGAFLGYRIGDILTKAITKPWGELMASRWREGKKFEPLQSFKALDKKGLFFEGACAVAGDLFGELVGVSVGLALFAGAGTLALPLVGAVSLAVAGNWLGSKLGRAVGRWVVVKVPKMFGKGAKAPGLIDDDVAVSATAVAPAAVGVPPVATGAVGVSNTHLALLQQRYQQAYADYVKMTGDTKISATQRDNALAVYKQAQEDLRSAQQVGAH